MGQVEAEPTIRNISDTAIWAAIYRAREMERPNALFRDPFAKRLTGERGVQIAAVMKVHDKHEWAWVMRTVLFDGFIAEQIGQGVDLVVNLAAGLDARPYRMALPSSLRWVEVDLPAILDYKEEILRGQKPVCALERVRLDLSGLSARRDLFRRLGEAAKKALIITEGLLIYLTAEEVGSLAEGPGSAGELSALGPRHCFAGSPAPAPARGWRRTRRGPRAAEVRSSGGPGILHSPWMVPRGCSVSVQGGGPREAAAISAALVRDPARILRSCRKPAVVGHLPPGEAILTAMVRRLSFYVRRATFYVGTENGERRT